MAADIANTNRLGNNVPATEQCTAACSTACMLSHIWVCFKYAQGSNWCIGAFAVGKLPFSGAPPDDRNLPDMHLALYNDCVVFDHATKLAYVISWVRLDEHPDIDTAYQVRSGPCSQLAQVQNYSYGQHPAVLPDRRLARKYHQSSRLSKWQRASAVLQESSTLVRHYRACLMP